MIRVLTKLVLILILVCAGVYIWYGRIEQRLALLSPMEGNRIVRQGSVKKTKQNMQKVKTYQIILSRNIFDAVLEQKDVVLKDVTAVTEEKEPEKTTLKLILQGTVTGSERDARAIIVDQKDKRQELYQVGDAVQGAFIIAIERGKVILEVNGEKQLLMIHDRGGSNSATRSRSTVPLFVPKKPVFVRPKARHISSPKYRSPSSGARPHRRINLRTKPVPDATVFEEPVAPLSELD